MRCVRRAPRRRAPLLHVAVNARLAGVFQLEDSLRYRSWKVDEQEMAPVVQAVLAAFIHDTHQVVLGGPWISNDPVDLAWNERRLVIGVVDTQSKWLCRLFHFSSKYLLIFKSRFLVPWASYQCDSTSRRTPFGKRTVAIPARPQQLQSEFPFISAAIQTENFWAVIKKATVTDLVKGSERVWRDRNFEIIVTDVIVGEIIARTIDAEEVRPIHTLQ